MLDVESVLQQHVLSCDYWLVARACFCGYTMFIVTFVGSNVETLTLTYKLILSNVE